MDMARDTRIEDLEFSSLSIKSRLIRVFKSHGLYTVGDILPLSKVQLLSFRGLGVNMCHELEKELQKGGFYLDDKVNKKNASEIYIYSLSSGGSFDYKKVKAVVTYNDNNTKTIDSYIDESDNKTHLMPEDAKIMGTTNGKIVWLDYLSVKDAAVIFTVWYEQTLSAIRAEYSAMKEIFSMVSDKLVKMIIYSE